MRDLRDKVYDIFKQYPPPWQVSRWEGDVILDKNGGHIIGCGEVLNKELYEVIVFCVNTIFSIYEAI